MLRPSLSGFTLTALLTPGVLAQAPDQLVESQHPDPQEFNRFGDDVDLEGDLAVVSATGEPTAFGEDGRAYVYERNELGAWILAAELEAPTAQYADYAIDVAIAGEWVHVSGYRADLELGVVDVYRKTAGIWSLDQTIIGPSFPIRHFGRRLAGHGDLLAVGAPWPGLESAVVVYREIAGTWTQEQILQPEFTNETYGLTLDTDGARIMFGDASSQGSSNRGRVWLYRYQAGTTSWVKEVVFTGINQERLGVDVAIDGDHAAAIAGEGIPRAYERVGGAWQALGPIEEAVDYETEACALDGDTLVVSYDQTWPPSSENHVRQYTRVEGQGWQLARVSPVPVGHLTFREFGDDLAIDGGTVLMGCPNTTDNPPFVGDGVALFRTTEPDALGTPQCFPALPSSTGVAASVQAFGSATASEDDLRLRAGLLPAGTIGMFIVSRNLVDPFDLPGSQGRLCLGAPIGRFASQIAAAGADGSLEIEVDLGALPQPGGPTAVLAGESWAFQCWFRDMNPGPTSNLSSATLLQFE